MPSFILNYGTEANGHVEMDFQRDCVKYWKPGESNAIQMTCADFERTEPELIKEMIRNGALRRTGE